MPAGYKAVGMSRVSSNNSIRLLWLTAGWLCFLVGAVGLVLPGLPTTGPLLLALACFARGSERMHQWLLHHRWFGAPLRRWEQDRVIPIKAKVAALLMMAISMLYLLWRQPLPAWATVVTSILLVVGMAVVCSIPHNRASELE